MSEQVCSALRSGALPKRLESVAQALRAIYAHLHFSTFSGEHPEVLGLPLEQQVLHFRREAAPTITSFFRDGMMLEAIRNQIFPSYAPSATVRVASVGCAGGEEPYSLLMDNWRQRERLVIHGYDIEPSNIAAACAGRYRYDISKTLVSRHQFEETFETPELRSLEGQALHIESIGLVKVVHMSAAARRQVNFRVHDIHQERLPEQYDVILLCSVLLHFTEQARARILHNIHASLPSGGWLVCESYTGRLETRIAQKIRNGGFAPSRPGDGPSEQPSRFPIAQVYRKP